MIFSHSANMQTLYCLM